MPYYFQGYSLDADRHELMHGSARVAVEPGVLDLLLCLIRNRERVVTKDDLIASVWGGRIVSESTITSRVTALRHAIGDSGGDQRLIRTVARKGFRFVADVSETPPSGAEVANGRAVQESRTEHVTALRLPDKPSIAVLPFTNMSGDPEQEYFNDGITEDIITALSRLRWFFVIARNSTFAFKGQGVDIRQIGRDLGVRYVLEGSVRRSGQRVRITGQLVDAATGNHIWSERYDRELTDIFALQDEITASVAGAIEPRLLAAEGHRSQSRSIEDLDAWDLVARALPHFWKMTAPDNEKAIHILRQAVERYPDYAPAHSMLAFALLMSAYVGWETGDRAHAATLARRAMELDENDPWGHLGFGFLAMMDRDTTEALRYFKIALDLNPNFATAAGFAGAALTLNGESTEAIGYYDKAVRMSPREPFTSFFTAFYGAALYLEGRLDEAIKLARQAVQLRPGNLGAHRILCASLGQAGYLDEAHAAMKTLRELHPVISIEWVRRSVPYTDRAMDRFIDGLRKAGLT